MEISLNKVNDTTVVSLAGHLDAITSSEVHEKLEEIVSTGVNRLVLDLHLLDYISSAGLQVILLTAKKISAAKGFFALANLKEDVKDVFEMSGFTSFLNIFNSVDESVQS